MFDRILVPLDGSSLAECVLPHIHAIASTSNPEIHLLRILDLTGGVTRPRPVDPFDWQIRKAEAESYLQEIASGLQAEGLQIHTTLLEGRAAESVLEYANRYEADLILLSSHGQSGLSAWNVSSVVQQVILRANRSIMIVRAFQATTGLEQRLTYQRILLPLDGSSRAECVLPVAEALARHYNSLLLIVHVVRQPEMPRRTPATQEDIHLAQQVSDSNREEASRYMMELKTRLDAQTETRVLVSDHVASSLHTLVEQENIDLVLLSAHGYSGETRWPYGSTVVSFIAYGTTPLLIIQDLPEDRIEPTRAELVARERGDR